MRILKLLFLILIICSCKEKTFADDIVLNFPKNEKLTIQKFNEDGNEMGSNLIYFGKIDSVINVKYYLNMIAKPLPPPPKNAENSNVHDAYLIKLKKTEDSTKNIEAPYFRREKIPIIFTEEYITDSLSNKNLSIIVKEKDTIPLYKKDYETKKIQKHKAFPVYIKNISGKTLKIPTEFNDIILYVKTEKNFQMVRNSNYMICGTFTDLRPYIELKKDEIMIFAFPHLQKGVTRKAKFIFYNAESKEFDISIDEKIITSQRNKKFLE